MDEIDPGQVESILGQSSSRPQGQPRSHVIKLTSSLRQIIVDGLITDRVV